MTQHAIIALSNTTATAITPYGTHSGMDITIQNVAPVAYVYIGGAGVTTSNYGYRIAPNNAWSIELPGNDELYAITDVNESQVAILTTNLESGE